jgi:segregation and condensation protein B
MSVLAADRGNPEAAVRGRPFQRSDVFPMDQEQLKRILEAALLASSHPLSLPQLTALFTEADAPSHEDLARALETLANDCSGRGVELREVASGFRYQVRQDVQPWIARLWTERQTRYSRALLETLSLIAYRQPITRGEIEQIRGVAVSTNIVKTLEEREWVRVVGYRDVPGKPELFGTTKHFLDYFNLKSLDELPALAEIRDVEEFDQLQLAPVASGDDGDSAAANDAELDEDAAPAARAAASAPPAEDDLDGATAEPDEPTKEASASDASAPEQIT